MSPCLAGPKDEGHHAAEMEVTLWISTPAQAMKNKNQPSDDLMSACGAAAPRACEEGGLSHQAERLEV